ncbi:MAG: alkanesulfonate monooxygenase [Proteobacteria bacterium]|jgi:alkanesulfonate monooxygenase SsuD/methylene tetrahydromethanopterin reductase-like flavin-dependent oxidoreductase (luciferase family)|nr:alkanesulfonate monooxygenase [Pseudomonadota bacterium]|tara:strand:- start:238 stop:1242 length:1005 start_codon:yes stop_codon:yes gene_type:complete
MARLGFWPPVYGNWIISTEQGTRDASFAYTKEATLLAERLGFDTMLIAEHFMNPVSPDLSQLDAWTTASALAALTENIEIITAVKPGFRAPGVIAKMASQIDHISNGRMAINLVSAWWLTEFEMLGAPVLAHDDRYARSEEFLEVIVGSWTEQEFSFSGEYYEVKEATLSPKPLQQPHPHIYIGGESEQGRTLGAKMADTFLINGRPPEEIDEIVGHVRRLAHSYGREPRFGMSAFVICRDTEDEAKQEFQRLLELRKLELKGYDTEVVMLRSVSPGGALGTNGGTAAGLVGTPEQIAERMGRFEDLGIKTFLFQFHPVIEEMERFGEQVMPLL